MTKMNDYSQAAQKAHSDLLPMLEAATTEASTRQQAKASETAGNDAVRPRLVAMIEAADTPKSDAIAGIVGTYAALLNNPATRDGRWLIASLSSSVKHHGLQPEQAGRIAGALVAAIHGRSPLSLIEWPTADVWHEHVHQPDLHLWAEWLAPAKYEKLATDLAKNAQARIKADTDLAQLKQARQALDTLVLEFHESGTIKVRNNKEHSQGIGGLRWEAGEVLDVAATDYVRLVDLGGYQRLVESGQLEVIA